MVFEPQLHCGAVRSVGRQGDAETLFISADYEKLEAVRPVWLIPAVCWLAYACSCAPDYEGRLCHEELPCPEGFACSNEGTCRHGCTVNTDCIAGEEVCVSGACTPIGQRGDAGPGDARSQGDAGDGDAGEADAGTQIECECGPAPQDECVANDTVFRSYADTPECDETTGACDFPYMEMPCPSCAATCLAPCQGVTCDETNGGCHLGGFCMPQGPGQPPVCVYQDAPDDTVCVSPMGRPGRCTAGECFECRTGSDCDDGNPCTADVCDTASGICSYAPSSGACDDGDGCTLNDVCVNGTCVGMDPKDCSTGAPECYKPSGTCDPSTGACVYQESNPGTSCDDGNACTQVDGCQAGTCVGDAPVTCSSPPGQCYEAAGTCNPNNGGCSYPPSPSTRTCDDGDACTYSDRCNGSGGCSGISYSCNDANACTSDACNGAGGCQNARVAPPGLNPSGGAVVSTMDVTLTWTSCADAVSYEVDIDWQRSDGTWAYYFDYTGETTNSKTFYPCSNAAPGLPCNGNFRFRVRAYNGSTFGPWSSFVTWHWNNCRAC